MKRTTVFLDEALLKRLKRVSRAEGKSFAAVVREAVAAYLVARPASGPRPLPSWVGMGDSGRSDISTHLDDFLWTDPHE